MPQADVVEHRRGLDDLGRGVALVRIQDSGQAVRKVVWQLAHGLPVTITT